MQDEVIIDIENPQESGDLINRKAVLQAVSEGCQELRGVYGRCEKLINALPPVTPKSETVTEFADRCRECGAKYGKLLKQKSGKWIEMDGYDGDVYYDCSERKPCINYSDGCEEWAGCPCVYYKAESEE